MRSIVTIALLIVFSSFVAADDPQSEGSIQGIWFGTGHRRVADLVLILQDGRFIVINSLGARESKFSVNPNAESPEIEIQRDDGRPQHGIYRHKEGTLRISLAEPEAKRPTSSTLTTTRLVLDRKPNEEGLKSLQKYLARELMVVVGL